MNLSDSPEDLAFREELRSWLRENAPAGLAGSTHEERRASAVAWYQELYDAGWLGLAWPSEYGGRDFSVLREAILVEEIAAAGAPPPPTVGYMGRAVLEFGSEQQRRRYLPPLLASRETWCQGFSEPTAGSDLANISTRAVLQGDEYVVSGHKIWTSFAQEADFCLLLCRTEPDSLRHKGLSMLIVPMTTPGIRAEPIVTARGDAEFCEVFFDQARVPASNVVGVPGEGWGMAMKLLAYERGPVDIGYQAKFRKILQRLAGEVRRRDDVPASVLEHLGRAEAAVEALRLKVLRSLSDRVRGGEVGAEGSIDKLLMARVEQDLYHLALEVLGADVLAGEADDWFGEYLYSRAATIYGGTAQIQRGILATRVLGLPA